MSRFSGKLFSLLVLILIFIGILVLIKSQGIEKIIKGLESFQKSVGEYFPAPAKVISLPLVGEERKTEETQEAKKPELEEEPKEEVKPKSGFEEAIEEIDEISEKIDLISQEIEELLAEKGKTEEKIEEIKEEIETPEEKKKIEEEKEEEEPDEEELKEKELEEKIEKKEIILCQKENKTPFLNKVIFNEVSWMGSVTDWRDEWLELKDISGGEVKLAGWQILDKNQEIKSIFEEKDLILSSGLFILERTNDDSVPGILADKIYPGNLNDSEEALYLFDENCQLQDEVLANPDWPAGNKDERRTMERKGDFTWQTYSGLGQNGIFGTPKQENSRPSISVGGGGAPPPPTQYKILISEIFFDAEASDEGQEFIELFNPNNSEVDISGWSIQYLSPSATLIDKIEKKNFEQGNRISSKSYFLIGLNGKEGDLKWSQSLGNSGGTVFLVNNKDKIIGSDDENLVDRVGYGSGSGLILAENLAAVLENFEAGKSIGRKWDESKEEYQDSDNNRDDFEIQEISPKEKNKTTVSPVLEDNLPPQVSFNAISHLQTETSFSLSWIGQDLAIEGVTPSGIDGFYIQYTTSPSDIDGIAIQYQDINNSWQDWKTDEILDLSEESNSISLIGENEKIYNFKIKAKDKLGNESDWSEIEIEINALPLVINEIAWMGSLPKEGETAQQAANNEWVELYNNTNSSIDLDDWLLKADDGTPEIQLSGEILAKSFYLLERTDDETVPNIVADKIYTGALSNSGEDFKIFDNLGKLIDSVMCGTGGWVGGDNTTKQTMERKNPKTLGTDSNNWGDSQNPGGSPKAQNSIFIQ